MKELNAGSCGPDFLLINAMHDNSLQSILVLDGVIQGCTAGKPDAPEGIPVVDAGGKLLLPSFIDAHVHFRDPGYEYKEDIVSGLKAAAYGGFGAVMAMANTNPVNDRAAVTRYMIEKAKSAWPYGPRLCPVGALTVGLEGKELAPMGELTEAGCVAFSNDGKPVMNNELFRRGIEYAAQWGMRVIDHCEDVDLARGSHMNEGGVSGRLGIKGQSVVAESAQVARDILLAEYLNLPIHLAHVSCEQSVNLLRWAKSKGIPVTAETCPHYIFLTEDSVEGYNTSAKVCPPLRTERDRNAIKEAVLDGLFDILVTDHAPHAAHEKEQTFDLAPNGMIGLEFAVPLTYRLVRENNLSLSQWIDLWHTHPAEIFGLPVNTFSPGTSADFFLFDPKEKWKAEPENLHSKSCNSPFVGTMLQGRVRAHWLQGRQLLDMSAI